MKLDFLKVTQLIISRDFKTAESAGCGGHFQVVNITAMLDSGIEVKVPFSCEDFYLNEVDLREALNENFSFNFEHIDIEFI